MNLNVLSDVIWIVLMYAWGTWDAHRNNKLKPIFLHHHGLAWMARLICGWAILQFVYFYPGVEWDQGWEWFRHLCKYCAIGWLVFDMGYNVMRKGIGIDHVGTTALPDKIFYDIYPQHPFWAQMLTKIFLIGVTTTIAWVF